jgi:hypothetical protein
VTRFVRRSSINRFGVSRGSISRFGVSRGSISRFGVSRGLSAGIAKHLILSQFSQNRNKSVRRTVNDANSRISAAWQPGLTPKPRLIMHRLRSDGPFGDCRSSTLTLMPT